MSSITNLIMQGCRSHADKHYDSNTMNRGLYTRNFPESSFPELERKYYKESLQEPFPENEDEIAEDIERRYLLKNVRTF